MQASLCIFKVNEKQGVVCLDKNSVENENN